MRFTRWLRLRDGLPEVACAEHDFGDDDPRLRGFLEARRGGTAPQPPWRGLHLITPADANPKTAKSSRDELRHPASGRPFSNVILHLSPANESGYRCCAWHSRGCARSCLHVAGDPQRLAGKIQGRLRRTYWLAHDVDSFLERLHREIARHRAAAEQSGRHLAVRLNGTSDIPWEQPLYQQRDWRGQMIAPPVMYAFPDVQFYDYTKSERRMEQYLRHRPGGAATDPMKFPPNYHLTFSLSEEPGSRTAAGRVLGLGGNVATVFNVFRGQALPKVWVGDDGRAYPVLDGDLHDLRFLDPPGRVVGLRAKGDALWDSSGFVVQPDDPHLQHPANAAWLLYALEKRRSREEGLRARQRKLRQINRARRARGEAPLPLTGGPGYQRRKANAVLQDYRREVDRMRAEYEDYARQGGRGRSGLPEARPEDVPFRGEGKSRLPLPLVHPQSEGLNPYVRMQLARLNLCGMCG